MTSDPRMLKILQSAEKAAATTAPVLITGESGTGKELIAGLVHDAGPRAARPFIKVNCAAIPETLLESELFGHEKGAFTNAVSQRKGKFELANEGTIFLDEIGDMSPSTQAKILRVLQEQEFERVGGTETIRSDIRVIAATNKDLRLLIQKDAFREDLYYRLCVITLHVPPLRERAGDVELLIDHFLRVFCAQYGKEIRGLDDQTRELLLAHTWPGNVRELKNCIERATIFCEGDRITLEDLPVPVHGAGGDPAGTEAADDLRAAQPLDDPGGAGEEQGKEVQGRRHAEHQPSHAVQPHEEARAELTMKQRGPLLVSMRDIHVSYDSVQALRGVDFDLASGRDPRSPGRAPGGEVDAGEAAVRRRDKERGTIWFRGQEVQSFTPKSAMQNRIAIVYQNMNVIPSISAIENIFTGQRITSRLGFLDRKSMETRRGASLPDPRTSTSTRTRASRT